MLSRLSDFVQHVCRMDRWLRQIHPCAIGFESDKGDPWMGRGGERGLSAVGVEGVPRPGYGGSPHQDRAWPTHSPSAMGSLHRKFSYSFSFLIVSLSSPQQRLSSATSQTLFNLQALAIFSGRNLSYYFVQVPHFSFSLGESSGVPKPPSHFLWNIDLHTKSRIIVQYTLMTRDRSAHLAQL